MKNKTIITVLAAALLYMPYSYAQKGFHIGGQWGPHLSWLINQDDTKDPVFEYLTTWRGAFAFNTQYGFTPHTGIGLSGLYSFQGQRYKLSGTELFKRVEYIKVPLLFIYNYKTTNRLMMIYKIGPQASFLTHARMTDKDGNDIVPDQMNAYRNMELGAMASLGLGIELMDKFFLDLAIRYDYGFTNAENMDHNTHINDPVVISNSNGHSADRAMTHTMTAGVNIGLRYLLCECDKK